MISNRLHDPFDGGFDIWEGCGWDRIGMEKCAGGVEVRDAASDESLRDERMQAKGRKRRNVHMGRVKPAGQEYKYPVSVTICQVAQSAMAPEALISGVMFQVSSSFFH